MAVAVGPDDFGDLCEGQAYTRLMEVGLLQGTAPLALSRNNVSFQLQSGRCATFVAATASLCHLMKHLWFVLFSIIKIYQRCDLLRALPGLQLIQRRSKLPGLAGVEKILAFTISHMLMCLEVRQPQTFLSSHDESAMLMTRLQHNILSEKHMLVKPHG